jgi:PASTA domain
VPLRESWQGKPCGPVQVDDPIPPEHAGGVEQLGNPWSCYGVALTISAGKRKATKRAAIQCGGIGGSITCSPAQLLRPPWVVGRHKRAAVERLRDAGFHVTVSRAERHKPGVPAGVVVAQEPERGLRMCRRADIWLVVSV